MNQGSLKNRRQLDIAGYQCFGQCGKIFFKQCFRKSEEQREGNFHLRELIREMDLAYAVADVIVSRAGALSVSELSIVGKPVIFIPSPKMCRKITPDQKCNDLCQPFRQLGC